MTKGATMIAKKITDFFEKQREIQRQFLVDSLKELFDKHPVLKKISWAQYTMYYCDGEPCEFSVYDFDINDINYYDIEYTIKDRRKELEAQRSAARATLFSSEESLKIDEELESFQKLEEISSEINELMRGIDNSYFYSLFGDHAKVTLTADGLTVEEYKDHD